MNVHRPIDATYMATDGLAGPDLFLLWALRQRFAAADKCCRLVSTGFCRVLGGGQATHALAALEATYQVLAGNGERSLSMLPPHCGFITHDEARLLSLCCVTQWGSDQDARRQATTLVGPIWSPFLFASLERLTGALARRCLRLSANAGALRRAFH